MEREVETSTACGCPALEAIAGGVEYWEEHLEGGQWERGLSGVVSDFRSSKP